MILTQYDKKFLQFGDKIKTSGAYNLPQDKTPFCKCQPQQSCAAESCAVCKRRVRV
jgi:hypothetical protein